MAMSAYLRRLRAAVGTDLLVLPAVTGIVYGERGAVLLVHQRDLDLWSTPGGLIEPHESPADAVSREVWEETGLYTTPRRILGVYGGPDFTVTYPNGDRVAYVTTVFECVVTGETIVPASEEVLQTAFVRSSDLSGYSLTPWAERILPALYRPPRPTDFDAAAWRPPTDAQRPAR